MAERREKDDSVLFSLQELRRLEDDRVKREQDDAKARKEAERQAKEATERRAREEEADRIRAEEERVRRVEEDKQARIREDHFRLEEAERRARVEGEIKLKEQRLHLEIQARKGGRAPLKAIAGVMVALVAIGGAIGYRMYNQHKEEQAVLQRKLDEERAQARAVQLELEKRMETLAREMRAKLDSATSEAERNRILAEYRAAQNTAKQEAERKRVHKPGGKGTTTAGGTDTTKSNLPKVPGKRQIGDGVLDGIDGNL